MIRHVYKSDNGHVRLAEHAPTKRTIQVYGNAYFLPFPYILFGLAYGQGSTERTSGWQFYALGSLQPVKTPEDVVFPLPLPNSYKGGQVCMGQHYVGDSASLNSLIKIYFSTAFGEGVSYGTNAWRTIIDPSANWTRFSDPFKMKWTTDPDALYTFFPKAVLPTPLNPNFNNNVIAQRAAQLCEQYPGHSDQEYWLAAEQDILAPLYKRGTSA